MQEAAVTDRIKELCKIRAWSYYRLAKESGIPYSTLNTMLNKGHAPTVPTLRRICDGFGITLSQFFSEKEESIFFTEEQREHLRLWNELDGNGRQLADSYIRGLLDMQKLQNR